MDTFKPGDRVVVNDNYDKGMYPMSAQKGATATVKGYDDKSIDGRRMIRVVWDRNYLSGNQMDGGYQAYRFDLLVVEAKARSHTVTKTVEEEVADLFVWVDKGNMAYLIKSVLYEQIKASPSTRDLEYSAALIINTGTKEIVKSRYF